jgi:predicted MFS family arabinose efflux permease
MTTPSPAGESGLAEPSVAPAAAYRWYVLAILMVTYAVHAMDRTIINVLLEPIRREFHLNDSAMGLLTGLGYAIPFAIAGMPLGALIDRTNRRRLLAALVATWSLFTAFGGLARTYLTLLVTRMAVGAAESGSPPAALSLISDFFPARLRATAVSIFYIGAPLGGMAGAYMGGVVTASHGWRAALFAAAAPGLIMALMILMTVREPRRGGQDAQQAPAEKVSFGAALKLARNPGLACVLAALVIGALSSVGVGTWTPALLMRAYDVPVQDTGKLVALINLVGAGGTALGGLLSDLYAKGRTERLLLLAGVTNLIAIPPFVLAVLAPDLATFLPAFLVWSVLHVLYWGPGFSLALGLAPSQTRGRLMALTFVLSNILGAGMGPQIVGLLSDGFALAGDTQGLRHAVACLSLAVAVAGGLFLLATRWVRPGVTESIT